MVSGKRRELVIITNMKATIHWLLEVISIIPDRASRCAAGADARKEEGAYPSVCDRRVTRQTCLPRPRGDGSGLLRWLLLRAPSLRPSAESRLIGRQKRGTKG